MIAIIAIAIVKIEDTTTLDTNQLFVSRISVGNIVHHPNAIKAIHQGRPDPAALPMLERIFDVF